MTDEPPERSLFSVEEKLPPGKVIHRWVEPPDGDAEMIGGQLRRMMAEHPGTPSTAASWTTAGWR